MRERDFQRNLIFEIKNRFPGCIILKNDPTYCQGIPDLLLLRLHRWAMLECKRSKNAPHRPNQDYYIEKLNAMSYAAFIYPENEEAIMHELERALC